jgi:hypothetical protein
MSRKAPRSVGRDSRATSPSSPSASRLSEDEDERHEIPPGRQRGTASRPITKPASVIVSAPTPRAWSARRAASAPGAGRAGSRRRSSRRRILMALAGHETILIMVPSTPSDPAGGRSKRAAATSGAATHVGTCCPDVRVWPGPAPGRPVRPRPVEPAEAEGRERHAPRLDCLRQSRAERPKAPVEVDRRGVGAQVEEAERRPSSCRRRSREAARAGRGTAAGARA